MTRKHGKNDRNTYSADWSSYGMRYPIVAYCNSIKGQAQRSTRSKRRRRTASVVMTTIGIFRPLGFVMVYNRRVNIVHNDRLRGYILRSWSGTERVEAASRRIFNPGKSEIISIHSFWDGVEQGHPHSKWSNKKVPFVKHGTFAMSW